MRKKILYTFFVLLLIVNGVLLVMLVQKSQNKENAKDRFLIEELGFNDQQEERFIYLDQEHRREMRRIDDQIRKMKEQLFGSFSDTTFTASILTKKIGELETDKEEEIYAFFKAVRKICTPDQAIKFDLIIKKALHNRGPKGRKGRRRPPPPR